MLPNAPAVGCRLERARHCVYRNETAARRPRMPGTNLASPSVASPRSLTSSRPRRGRDRVGDEGMARDDDRRSLRTIGFVAPNSAAITNDRHPDRPVDARLGLLLRHPRGQKQKRRRPGRSGDDAELMQGCDLELRLMQISRRATASPHSDANLDASRVSGRPGRAGSHSAGLGADLDRFWLAGGER